MLDMTHYDDPLLLELLRKYWKQSFNPMDSLAADIIRTGIRTKRWWKLTQNKELRTDKDWNSNQSYWFEKHARIFFDEVKDRNWPQIQYRWEAMLSMLIPERFTEKGMGEAAYCATVFDTNESNDDDQLQYRTYILQFINGYSVPKYILDKIINDSNFLLPEEKENLINDNYTFWRDHYNWHLATMRFRNGTPEDTELTVPYYGGEEDDDDEYY